MPEPNFACPAGSPFTVRTRALAWLCRLCPACNVARHWPDSQFAKKLVEAEKNCPACRAYRQVYSSK